MISTTELVQEIRARHAHHEFKVLLKEKYTAQLLLVHSGGMWTINAQFLAMLRALQPHHKNLVLLDAYDNPVEVDVTDLVNASTERYETVMKNWRDEGLQSASLR
jgi:hypothetical protein